jgi:PH (Pleckstrin Homology) domain-containing protein
MTLSRIDSQAVTGVTPPQQQEAMIREVWETTAANGPAMTMARKMIRSVILAPIGWLLLAPIWGKRFLGFLPGMSFLTVKFTLTNRRLMIRKGMKAHETSEIPLNQIGEVHTRTDGNSDYYSTADLDIQRKDGSVAFTLKGVPEPESFRQAILQARDAWGPYL